MYKPNAEDIEALIRAKDICLFTAVDISNEIGLNTPSVTKLMTAAHLIEEVLNTQSAQLEAITPR